MREGSLQHHLSYSENKMSSDSYISKRLKDNKFCYCGQSKLDTNDEGCPICMSDIMQSIKLSAFQGQVSSNLKTMLDTTVFNETGNVVNCSIGWITLNFTPNFINKFNRKIINLVKKKKHLLCICFYASASARNLSECLCSFGRLKACHE